MILKIFSDAFLMTIIFSLSKKDLDIKDSKNLSSLSKISFSK